MKIIGDLNVSEILVRRLFKLIDREPSINTLYFVGGTDEDMERLQAFLEKEGWEEYEYQFGCTSFVARKGNVSFVLTRGIMDSVVSSNYDDKEEGAIPAEYMPGIATIYAIIYCDIMTTNLVKMNEFFEAAEDDNPLAMMSISLIYNLFEGRTRTYLRSLHDDGFLEYLAKEFTNIYVNRDKDKEAARQRWLAAKQESEQDIVLR